MEKALKRFLNSKSLQEIGFHYIMNNLAPLTPYGQRLKNTPYCYRPGEEQQLIIYLEALNSLREDITNNPSSYKELYLCMSKLKDISGSLKQCKNHGVLDEVDFFEIKNFTMKFTQLKELWTSLDISKTISWITFRDIKEVLKLLDPDSKGLPTFFIYDSYSPLLKEIRLRKKALESKLLTCPAEKLQSLKAHRLKVVNEELCEELRIREELSYRLSLYIDSLEANISAIGELDILLSKAQMASKYQCCNPSLEGSLRIEMVNGSNPYIQSLLSLRGKSFKGVSISLKQGTAVITGANMGGKTVALKTLALNVVLVHLGFLPFASSLSLCLFDFIYFSSENRQEVSKGLSSFATEIVELNESLSLAHKERGLLLLDEFARGTNPQEGYILCKSLVSYINTLATIALITTHYDGVAIEAKEHYQCRGLKSVNLSELKEKIALSKGSSVDIIQDYMDFTLERIYSHHTVPKDGLNICRLLGFNEEVLKEAEKYYNKEDYDGK